MAQTKRYMTPLKYTNGHGITKTTKLYFELAPTDLTDWVLDNPFEANELLASIQEMEEVFKEDSRDLTREEVQVLMNIIRILARLSAGRPSEDGEYFIKDPNWTSSYAYRGFREMLFTRPKEMVEFMNTVLDDRRMTDFMAAVEKVNKDQDAEKDAGKAPSQDLDQFSTEELRKMIAERETVIQGDQS